MENKKIEELRNELCEKVTEANAKLNEGVAQEKAKEVFSGVLIKLNDELFNQMCAELRASETPLLDAVKRQTYTEQVVKCNYDRKTNARSFEIGTKQTAINPIYLQDFIERDIGHKIGWQYKAENLGRLLAARKAGEIGDDMQSVLDNYKLSKQTKRTTEADPLSDATAIKWLQEVVDAMYFKPYVSKKGETKEDLNAFKVTSHDLAFVEAKATTGARDRMTIKVATSNKHRVSLMMMEVLNHLIFGVPYSIEYPKARAN